MTVTPTLPNRDEETISSFGDEWSRFDQAGMAEEEARRLFDQYFSIFPWDTLRPSSTGFDMGCGTGRWAKFVAAEVGVLHCIDPSSALEIAKHKLAEFDNVVYHKSDVDHIGLASGSQDFGYSLGVLHHVPDTASALRSCVDLLKPGAPFLVYLYYAFDNRSVTFRMIWRCSDFLRRVITRLPPALKNGMTDILAALVYFPLARISRFLEMMGANVEQMPLSYYRRLSFYTMRTDSRDRFGTPLEQRFSRVEIAQMMQAAGLTDVRFSESAPYWCAVGWKSS
jgi:ubiquinone/menaquinone biosynthesis C-methylase UbiE